MTMDWDAFISHATEDKERFVRPLAQLLDGVGVKVWFDEFTLRPGRSLSEQLDIGMANSQAGIVVFSRAFFRKKWTKYELAGLVHRFVTQDAGLIPVWLNIDQMDVAKVSPALANVVAIKASSRTIPNCAVQIIKSVRPDLYRALRAYKWLEDRLRSGKRQLVKMSEIHPSPIRHETLPESLLIRIKNLHSTFDGAVTMPLERWIDGFRRDLRPAREVEIWEKLAAGYVAAVRRIKPTSEESRRNILSVLLAISSGTWRAIEDDIAEAKYNLDFVQLVADEWVRTVPPIADRENTPRKKPSRRHK